MARLAFGLTRTRFIVGSVFDPCFAAWALYIAGVPALMAVWIPIVLVGPLLVRSFKMGISANGDRIVVTDFFSTHSYPVDEVTQIGFPPLRPNQATPVPLRIAFRDGSHIRVRALSRAWSVIPKFDDGSRAERRVNEFFVASGWDLQCEVDPTWQTPNPEE